jgi:hypothetical protein
MVMNGALSRALRPLPARRAAIPTICSPAGCIHPPAAVWRLAGLVVVLPGDLEVQLRVGDVEEQMRNETAHHVS